METLGRELDNTRLRRVDRHLKVSFAGRAVTSQVKMRLVPLPNPRPNLLIQLKRDPIGNEIPKDPAKDFMAHSLGSVVGFREPVPRLIHEGDLVPIIDPIPDVCLMVRGYYQLNAERPNLKLDCAQRKSSQ